MSKIDLGNLQRNRDGSFKVIAGFDINSFRKARAKSNPKKLKDLEATLNEISPKIAALNVGAVLPLEVDKSMTYRQNIMRVRAPLTNITLAGRPWAGRQFEVVGDEDKGVILIFRGEDLAEPKTRAPSTRGQANRVEGDTAPAVPEDAAAAEAVVQTT